MNTSTTCSTTMVLVSSLLCGPALAATADSWSGAGGPGNGGLVRQVVVTGSTATQLYAAIYGGGVYKSSDAGASWSAVNNGLNNLRVWGISVMSQTELFAGTDGNGIFKSTDGGATWTSSNSGLGCSNVRQVTRDPITSTTYYAATTCEYEAGGLYKSLDSGATWTLDSALPSKRVGSLQLAVANGVVIRTAATYGDGAFRSTDGVTWSALGDGQLTGPNGKMVYSAFRISNTVSYATVEGAGVFKSTDNGVTWALQSSGLPNGKFQAAVTCASNCATLYLPMDGNGIYRSVDGGATWSSWVSADKMPAARTVVLDPLSPTTFYVATHAGVYKSTDNGATWSAMNSGLPGGYTQTSATHPTDSNIVFATADTLYKSTDGGSSWTRSDTGLTGTTTNSGVVVIDSKAPDTLLVTLAHQGVFKTTNGGSSWSAANNGLPDLSAQRGNLRFDPTNSAVVYAFFQSGNTGYGAGIYRSSNGGDSWTAINNGLSGSTREVYSLTIDPKAPSTLYLSTGGGLFKSSDSGSTWTRVFAPTDANKVARAVSQAAVDPVLPSTLYLAACNSAGDGTPYPTSGIHKSTDSGATWTQLSASTCNRRMRAVNSGGSTVLYSDYRLDASGGVIKSTDFGATWTAINSGLGSPYIYSLEVSSGSTRLLRASTHNGVYNFLAGGGFSITASATGTNAALKLTAKVESSTADAGKTGNLYVVAVLPGGAYYVLTATGWAPWNNKVTPYSTGVTLGSHSVSILDGSLDVSSIKGTAFVVGYGTDEADLLTNKKYAVVYAIQ